MAKKPANTPQFSIESSSSSAAAPQKAPAFRSKKHLKAQALGVAAAVEGFVNAITQTPTETEPAEPIEATPEEITPFAAPVAEHLPPASPVQQTSISQAPITHEQIAALAFSYYEKRNGHQGSQADDWLRAEQTLKAGRS